MLNDVQLAKVKKLLLNQPNSKFIIVVDYFPGGDMTKNWLAVFYSDQSKTARGTNTEKAANTLIEMLGLEKELCEIVKIFD